MSWLTDTPLFGVTLTLAAYVGARWVFRRTGSHAAAQPVLIAIVVVVAVLWASGTSYADYLRGGQFIAFLLGPATVALALPLHREWERVRRSALPIVVGTVVGAITSITAAVLAVRWLGGADVLELTLAPKAATTPVSIAISERIGGLPPLTAGITILAGILGAVLGPWVLSLARIRDERARGLAIGAASHGIGTSRALAESRTEGAFSGLSMALTALATSVLVPVIVALLHVG